MKLIFVQYLASLKERGELDVIMPDLLSEIGFTVVSRPSIGTRQYGVDVAAVGTDSDGVRKMFLISIKAGDLKRSDWDVGEQALRPSLNEIRDVYIPKFIPCRYRDLPVAIVICLGGDIHEHVRTNVESYIDHYSGEFLTYQIWNGDHLAGLLLSGVLRENALPENWRSDFRKSVALVDEPAISFRNFCQFLSNLSDNCKASRPARLRAIRQIHLGLWTLFIWAREADNTEAAYLGSERALLITWDLVKDSLTGKSKEARQIRQCTDRLMQLHNLIADDYLTRYVAPRAGIIHGLTWAIPGHVYLDKNLRMFDLLGRIGLRGLWLLHMANRFGRKDKNGDLQAIREALRNMVKLLMDVIQHNPLLNSPIQDSQAIDINIACLFLRALGSEQTIKEWVRRIANSTIFAFRTHGPYPCVHTEYSDLAIHPKAEAGYRNEATVGSLLLPTLAVWSAISADDETLGLLREFAAGEFSHSSLQLLYPGEDTETHLYSGDDKHGQVDTNVVILGASEDMLAPVKAECAATWEFFRSLSAVNLDIWPLVLLACRHNRIPVPPQLWPLS